MEVEQSKHAMDKYVPHIISMVSAIEPLRRLMDGINVPFGDPVQKSDSAKIFGGFLRWIVETVAKGSSPTLAGFIATKSDIDVRISEYYGCKSRLSEWFKYVIDCGGIIEYSGIEYGKSTLKDVHVKYDGAFPAGCYMVYIPLRNVCGANMDVVTTNKKHSWLKIDVMYAARTTSTDFTANSLYYPDYEGDIEPCVIEDIISRRLLRSTETVTPKLVYRALRMLRRGYKFAEEMSLWRMAYIAMSDLKYKNRVSRKHALSMEPPEHAFVDDTSTPSVGKSEYIVTTKHPCSIIDNEFLMSQADFKKFYDRVNEKYRSVQTLYPFTNNLRGVTNIVSNVNTENTIDITVANENTVVRTVRHETTMYKICCLHVKSGSGTTAGLNRADLNKSTVYDVCVALSIPPDTQYACAGAKGYAQYRFKHAKIVAVYAYPNVDITRIVTGNKNIELLSEYDTKYVYEVGKLMTAKNVGGEPMTKITADSPSGIYAYTEIDIAWNNYGRFRKLMCSDVPDIESM